MPSISINQITSQNIIKVINKKGICSKIQCKSLNFDEFSSSNKISVTKAMTNLTNWFSCEDLEKINKKIIIYNTKTQDELKNLLEYSKIAYFKEFEQLPLVIEKNENFHTCEFDPSLITQNHKKNLKAKLLDIVALQMVIQKDSPYLFKTPLSYWYPDTDLGIQKARFLPKPYEHPADKATKLFGSYTKEDINKLKKKQNKHQALDVPKIFAQKQEILSALNNYYKNHKVDFEAMYSEKELKQIKELTLEYRALNNIQKSKGYYTKDLESLLFSQEFNNSTKKGDYIDGLGLVVNRQNIDDKDYIITFSDVMKDHTFCLFELGELQKGKQFIETLPTEIEIGDLDNLNTKAKEIIDSNKALVSRIGFTVKNGKDNQYLKDKNIHNDDIATNILAQGSDYYYIQNFVNNFPKTHPKAGKIVGIQLLKFLKEQPPLPVFLEARGKHSPVSMYLRIGFQPFSHTKEELFEKMAKNKNEFPSSEAVSFYLKDFSNNGDRIEAYSKIFNL